MVRDTLRLGTERRRGLGLGVGLRRGLGVGLRRGLGVGWGLGVGRRLGLGLGLGVGWRRGLGVGLGLGLGLGVGWRRGPGVAPCDVGTSPVVVPAVSFSSGTMSFAVSRIESSKASREVMDRDPLPAGRLLVLLLSGSRGEMARREVREPTLSLRALVLGEVEAAPRIESSKASREAMDRDPLPAGRLLVLGSGTLGGLLLSWSRGEMARREVREPTLSLRALVLGSMLSARVVFILLLLGSRDEVVRRELMVAARLRRGVVFGLSLSGSRGVMASRELREPTTTLSLRSVNVSTPPVSLAGRASR